MPSNLFPSIQVLEIQPSEFFWFHFSALNSSDFQAHLPITHSSI